jgi:hypothetical protein
MVGKATLATQLSVSRPLLPDVTAILADPVHVRLELKHRSLRFLPQVFAIVPRTLAVDDMLVKAERQGIPVSHRISVRGDPRLFPELRPQRFAPYTSSPACPTG